MTVTSRDIMKALNIKNVKTLTRWHNKVGVIPKPTVEKHPGGIGRTAVWPAWVLDHCRVIKDLTSKGEKLADIAATYGNDWDAIARRYQRRYVFADVSKKMEHDNQLTAFRESIEKTIAQWMVSVRQRLLATTLPPIAGDIAIQAVDLARDGYNPVLVLYQDRTEVAPDFMVGHYLSNHFGADAPLLVIPLHSLVNSYFGADDIPEKPTVRPSRKIDKSGPRVPAEESLDIQGDWQFRKSKSRTKQKRSK